MGLSDVPFLITDFRTGKEIHYCPSVEVYSKAPLAVEITYEDISACKPIIKDVHIWMRGKTTIHNSKTGQYIIHGEGDYSDFKQWAQKWIPPGTFATLGSMAGTPWGPAGTIGGMVAGHVASELLGYGKYRKPSRLPYKKRLYVRRR